MPTEEIIRNVVQDLKSTYALRTVNIFGSYAEGRATANSDLDLLVEFDHPTVSLIKLNALKYDLEDAHKEIPRRAISGMRDITAHKYQTLRKEDVYSTCVDDIPIFEKQLARLVHEDT